MNNLKIAAAQVASVRGDIDANLATHLRAVRKAAESGVNYIVFPELSLTGYEPEQAAELALSEDDSRLVALTEAARHYAIHIVAGAPLRSHGQLRIGALICGPDGKIGSYAKMHLHPGEADYFSAGQHTHSVTLGGHTIATAICADTAQPAHVRASVDSGAGVYAAGVLISAGGYPSDTRKLQDYARQHGLLVAIANHNRPTGGWQPIGRSAIWTPAGLLACADETMHALVIAESGPSGWVGTVAEL